MKLLYILNQTSRINTFSMSSLLAAKSLDIEFHIAGNWSYSSEMEQKEDEEKYGIRIYQIDFRRNPFHPGNLKAYRQLSEIARNEKYNAIHCNTPIGGLIGRIIGQRLKVKKVIYQAHGFHFYHGAPIISWLLYYPAEKLMARITDELICINLDDFGFAKDHFRLRNNGRIHYIPGVGIDTVQYDMARIDKKDKLEALGIPSDRPLVLSVGELNPNKNHATVIHAMKMLPQVHYAIAGKGSLENQLKETAAMFGVSERVHFLGFRTDLARIYPLADVFCLPSRREGLSTSIMEAMASGLPIVCSDIRGNRDLVIQNEGGYLVKSMDISGYASAIESILENPDKLAEMAAFNTRHIRQFSLDHVIDILQSVYKQVFNEETAGMQI